MRREGSASAPLLRVGGLLLRGKLLRVLPTLVRSSPPLLTALPTPPSLHHLLYATFPFTARRTKMVSRGVARVGMD